MKPVAIILILFSPAIMAAQDLEFSQFFNAPLYMNPALAGVDEGPRFTLNYRNQWAGLGDAYLSYAASYDQHIESLDGSVGLIAVSDRQANGIYVSNSISGIYAYRFNITRQFTLQTAAQVSLIQRRLKSEQLIFSENINPDDGSVISAGSNDIPDQNSRMFPDFGAGVLWYTPKFFGGLSAKHVTAPNESLISSQSSPLPMRWAANMGFEFHSRKNSKRTPVFFTPNFLYVQQSKFKQLTGGAILGVGVVYGGVSYRTTFSNADAVILLAGLQEGIFRFGYSFDASVSELKGNSGGTHELALVLNFHDSDKIKSKRSKRKSTNCPDVF